MFSYLPVLHAICNAKTTHNVKRTCTDWKKADWKSWIEEVEANLWVLQLTPSNMNNGEVLWKQFLNVVQNANKNHIPNKTVSVHSKPYWNTKLSECLLQTMVAKENFIKRSTPFNKDKLKEAKDIFSGELTAAKIHGFESELKE